MRELELYHFTKLPDITEPINDYQWLIAKKALCGTSLVVQWLRFLAPNAGASVQFLVREVDSTCHN